ncbi:hypothetical protein MSG28_004868 [Choristoneura fumiferana]|uniref:Uncharacterized protein n=1 Tax=Choristoneura fumiferana TaxID=7141 RepID=A0ACC0K7N3_CHOFU|nr:hypothetical protein MSG28_004868 [Choristoneura fumiferana]
MVAADERRRGAARRPGAPAPARGSGTRPGLRRPPAPGGGGTTAHWSYEETMMVRGARRGRPASVRSVLASHI